MQDYQRSHTVVGEPCFKTWPDKNAGLRICMVQIEANVSKWLDVLGRVSHGPNYLFFCISVGALTRVLDICRAKKFRSLCTCIRSLEGGQLGFCSGARRKRRGFLPASSLPRYGRNLDRRFARGRRTFAVVRKVTTTNTTQPLSRHRSPPGSPPRRSPGRTMLGAPAAASPLHHVCFLLTLL